MPKNEQPVTSSDEPSDAEEDEVAYITTRDGLNDVNDAAQSRSERLIDDVNKRNEATEYVRSENPDQSDSALYPKNQRKSLPDLSKGQKKYGNYTEENSSNENNAQDSPNKGDDNILPEISQNEDRKKV